MHTHFDSSNSGLKINIPDKGSVMRPVNVMCVGTHQKEYRKGKSGGMRAKNAT